MGRIEATFDALGRAGRKALMPYLTVGYPERRSALDLVPALVEGGADLIELGVPFSDPLADGATIQAASQQALANGMTLRECLEQAAELRASGIEVPLVLMGYWNPVLQMGVEEFATRATAAGVDGVILPDLPPEEAEVPRNVLGTEGIDLVFLLAPTSGEERARLVAERTSGFLYLVSLTGVTGERDELPPGLASFVERVRPLTRLPLAVGFGISKPAQAAAVARLADGVIVGSALIRAIGESKKPAQAARQFVRSLRQGIDNA
ncbi:MAG: tryptophan synthase subunit alpha [Anaerolineales bacterium]|nr:MAG: tryptophan synthase subunit alpha [Anaerolineales bacterium]